MIRTAICSGDRDCLEQVSQVIAQCNQCGQTAEALSVDAYSSLQALVDNVEDGDLYDVFLLGWEGSDREAFALVRRLREKLDQAVLLILTSCSDLAFTSESGQLRVFRYVNRQALEQDLPEALSAAVLEAETHQPYYLLVTYYHDLARVAYQEIQYVHRVNRATQIVVKGGESLRDSRSLAQVFHALHDPRFQYIDRGCFVNLDYITRISGKEVQLKGGASFTASSVQLSKVREKLLRLWGGEEQR